MKQISGAWIHPGTKDLLHFTKQMLPIIQQDMTPATPGSCRGLILQFSTQGIEIIENQSWMGPQ